MVRSIDATATCRTKGGDEFAFLQIYGAQSRGPYLHGIKNNTADPAVDTIDRVCKGIAAFTTARGVPNAIVLATLNWDAQLYIEGAEPPIDPFAAEKPQYANWTTMAARPANPGGLALYERELRDRLREIAACKHPASLVYLQTTQTVRRDCSQYNDVLRRLASETGLGVAGILDVDRMLRGGELDPPALKGCESCRYQSATDNHPSNAHGAAFARYAIRTAKRRGVYADGTR